jgi:hypothetical protein
LKKREQVVKVNLVFANATGIIIIGVYNDVEPPFAKPG